MQIWELFLIPPNERDFNPVTDEMLKQIVMKINRRPRLKLNFTVPVEEFFKFIS